MDDFPLFTTVALYSAPVALVAVLVASMFGRIVLNWRTVPHGHFIAFFAAWSSTIGTIFVVRSVDVSIGTLGLVLFQMVVACVITLLILWIADSRFKPGAE